MNAVAEAAARAAAIIRMKQQTSEKIKTQGVAIEQLLAKPESIFFIKKIVYYFSYGN